jgi:hypothetical protein
MFGLEYRTEAAYSPSMDDVETAAPVPSGWLEVLAESEAELAAGLSVSGDVIMRELDESIARLEAKQASQPTGRTTRRR